MKKLKCNRCGLLKSTKRFYTAKTKRGFAAICIDCRLEQNKQYRVNNKLKIKVKRHEIYLKKHQ